MKKKTRIDIIFIIVGLVVFNLSIIGFVIDAVTTRNVVIGWILLAFIIAGSGMLLFGLIKYLLFNKDKIKKYLDEITK